MKSWKARGWLQGARRIASPNEEARPPGSVVYLAVVHSISLPPGEFGGDWVERFFVNRLPPDAHPYFAEIAHLKVSAHFFIARDGKVVQFVACDRRAWHAGVSSWQGRERCNDFSVGIELEGTDERAYTEAQYEGLWTVLDALRERYPIDAVVGHCHVAPGRKTDPGPQFDWTRVRDRYPTLALPPE